MKCNVMRVSRSSIQRAAQQEQTQKMIDEYIDKRSKQYSINTMILHTYTIHKVLHLGKKKLEQILAESVEHQKYMTDRYEDADLFAMEKHLKENVGIDIRAMIEAEWDKGRMVTTKI